MREVVQWGRFRRQGSEDLNSSRPRVAVYPGSFDPVTYGHLDLIERCAPLVDKLWVAVWRNANKQPMFSAEERVEMLREATRHLGNVEVDSFDGLLVEYARKRGACLLLRGIRAISDYEYELQMALMNRRLAPDGWRSILLPELTAGEGGDRTGRQCQRPGAAPSRGEAEGAAFQAALRREIAWATSSKRERTARR